MPTSFGVSLFREPDAGNLPVRFDEREQETEPSQTGLRPRRESVVSSHRETKATAPVLDSTRHFTHNRSGCNHVWVLKNSFDLFSAQNLICKLLDFGSAGRRKVADITSWVPFPTATPVCLGPIARETA